ncbi:MAG: hypothetical protein KKA60_14580 [Proteobacteria bacterium]|nr:hypothetical protein [Pseudomonadota bacterium]
MNPPDGFHPDRSHLPGASGTGWEVRVDQERNRLFLNLGALDLEQAKEVVLAMGRWVWKLTPGYTVMSDFTLFLPVDQKVALYITRGQTVLRKSGMGKGVRVVSSHLTALQFSRRGKQVGLDVDTVQTLAEARVILDRWEREQERQAGKPEEKS